MKISANVQKRSWASICLVICCGMFSVVPAVRGQIVDDWNAARSELDNLAKQGRCTEGWDLFWRWAKSGNSEARAAFGMAIYFDFLSPPGLNQDLATLRRHKYTFIIHALLSLDAATASPEMLEVRQDFLKHRTLTGGQAHPFYDCLMEADRHLCSADLIRDGFVADFEGYARELDAVAKLSGAKPATCGTRIH